LEVFVEIEIRPADGVADADALCALDAKIFLPSDCFEPAYWADYEVFWIVVDGQIVGSIALGLNMVFSGDWKVDKKNPGCLYIASTGILPEFQHKGVGNFVKQWEIDWARSHGYAEISTHCRKSNVGSLRLNTKFGFEIIGELLDYYTDPIEPTVVMELKL
jgi:ribosomal protein S18 acetylase RimI-like enzyme